MRWQYIWFLTILVVFTILAFLKNNARYDTRKENKAIKEDEIEDFDDSEDFKIPGNIVLEKDYKIPI